jgi:hypothetical protein
MESPATGKIAKNTIFQEFIPGVGSWSWFLEFRGERRTAGEGPEAHFRNPHWT